MSTIDYLKTFVTDKNVASVTPSSRFLTRRICRRIDFNTARTVVEFGPGNGVITRPLLERMPGDGQLITIETNETFVEQLNAIPDSRLSVVGDSVARLPGILNEHNVDRVDYVVSGIPFSFLDDRERMSILDSSRKALGDEGVFLAYQTSRHLEPDLRKVFDHVSLDKEWLNIPPMCIYEAWMDRADR